MLNYLPEPLAKVIARLLEMISSETPLYMVGGAVRDILTGRQVHDLDLALPGGVLNTARKLADALGAAYYPLDAERDTARIVLAPQAQPRWIVDIAALRGAGIESDLRMRDFTVNAIAVELRNPAALIDPLNGAADLHARRLRLCSEHSLLDDPARIMRAVRVAFAYQLRITPETSRLIRQAVPRLFSVSIERLRDELFRILSASRTSKALRMLDHFNALDTILPELAALKGVTQSPPHVFDVWEHTLAVVDRLGTVLSILDPVYDPDQAGSLSTGLVALRLGRFRRQIGEHLQGYLTPERSIRSLLMVAALYHDIAKPRTFQVDEEGRKRFFDHEQVGAELVHERARLLRLSTEECDRLRLIVRHHMRPMLLAQSGSLPGKRAVYRFFRDTGPAGVDVCLLSLADFLGTYGAELPQVTWAHHLDMVRVLLEAWWEQSENVVRPPRLLDGNQLINRFGLDPGPQIGEILDAVQEAQAEGEVSTLEEAFHLAQKIINGE